MFEAKPASLAIGVDLGATKIAAVLATRAGETIATRHTPTQPERGPAAVLDDIAGLCRGLIQEATAHPGALAGVGVGSPGRCDPLRGLVRDAVNLGWESVALVDEVRGRLDCLVPVFLQKDANASALGEYTFGVARNVADFVYLSVGSGLGGGIVANGALVTGATWSAAEVGHISLDPVNGRRCACGLRGCAETVVSGGGLVKTLLELRAEHAIAALPYSDAITPKDILAAARGGDALALRALEATGSALGRIAVVCLGLLNPACLVIGGGLGLAAFDLLLPAVQHEIALRALPASYADLTILPSRLASSALGAAACVWYGLETQTAKALS